MTRPESTYELHALGWKAFQDLCSTLLREKLGQTFQPFADTNDGGRDGAFYGEWENQKEEKYSGSFTVQCKFTNRRDHTLSISQLSEELEKTKKLAKKGLADNYILITNAIVSGDSDRIIKREFENIEGVKRCLVLNRKWICETIHESPRIRRMVPRLYGLGDLSEIMDERCVEQAKEILDFLAGDLSKFVITDAYRKSAKALSDHRFVLLVGEPASGKSTIAAALALSATDEQQCNTFKITTPGEFKRHSNPNDPRQFFWIDDAFGATQFEPDLGSAWNQVFSHMQAAIHRGAFVLMTSRDYIYTEARKRLKQNAFPLLNESQVVIKVEELSIDEKAQILYNHLKLGTQPKKFRSDIKPYLSSIPKLKHFLPEIARRLANPAFTKKLRPSQYGLSNFFENPSKFLQEILDTIDDNGRAAIAAVFMKGGILPSPVELSDSDKKTLDSLAGSKSEIISGLNSLNGSLLQYTTESSTQCWKFRHPTVRDAFAELISINPELFEIYLKGAPIDRMVNEIVCLGIQKEGAKVTVPESQYPLLIERLGELDDSEWYKKKKLIYFLTNRCDDHFLLEYLNKRTDLIPSLDYGSFPAYSPEVDLAVKAQKLGILSEEERMRLRNEAAESTIINANGSLFDKRVVEVVGEDDWNEVFEEVVTELESAIDEIITDQVEGYNENEDDPEDFFYYQESSCGEILSRLNLKDPRRQTFEDAISRMKEIAKQLFIEREKDRDMDSDFDINEPDQVETGERSIFDDVDE